MKEAHRNYNKYLYVIEAQLQVYFNKKYDYNKYIWLHAAQCWLLELTNGYIRITSLSDSLCICEDRLCFPICINESTHCTLIYYKITHTVQWNREYYWIITWIYYDYDIILCYTVIKIISYLILSGSLNPIFCFFYTIKPNLIYSFTKLMLLS